MAAGQLYNVGDGSRGTVPKELGGGIDSDSYEEEYWYIRKAESVMHFILLTIDGPHQHMVMIDSKGNIIDEYPETPLEEHSKLSNATRNS